MKKLLIAGLLCTLFAGETLAQAGGRELKLIPVPKLVEIKGGSFEFSPAIEIRVKNPENIGLEEFTAFLKSEIGVTSSLSYTGIGKSIRIEKRSKIGVHGGDEAYLIEVNPGAIVVAGITDAGIFYGLQTLTQLVMANRDGNRIPCCTIRDYPDIPVRGWQDDISRGPIPTMEFLKRQVRTLAAFKLNAMTLYTEHVFKMKKHPTLAPGDGITQEQIAELSAYAAKYHVQVIGNFQSFGHMEKILSKPGYQHLAESGHILTPTKEESYQFMKEVYSEVVPAYSSPFFNINCDETFGLGETLSKKMADTMGIEGIYGYHINRLNELLKPYGKRILMWGDIAANPKIVSLLPKDITVISWGYHDAPSFDYAITPFSSQKLNFWVAPGVSCWGNVFPNLSVAEVNISNYIRDGFRLGATGVINTTWDDDGLNFFENNWHGLVYGAEKSWNAPESELVRTIIPATENARFSGFDDAFDELFFGVSTRSVASWMKSFSALHQNRLRAAGSNARVFEPVMPFYPEYVDAGQVDLNLAVLVKLDSLEALLPAIRKEAVKNTLALDYMDFALDEVRFTARKNLFRIELFKFLKGDAGAMSAEKLKNSLKGLIRESENLGNRYTALWKLESRNWWLDRNQEKFDRLSQDLRDLRGLTILDFAETVSPAGREVKMRSMLDNLPVFFTLDGSVPDKGSPNYTGPVYLNGDVTLRARVIAEGREFPEAKDSLLLHKAIGRLRKLNCTWSPYHPAYDAGGKLGLIDGRTGSAADVRSGRWQGYSGQSIDVELDLGRAEKLTSFSMGFYQHTFSWVILPKQVDIYLSDDGNNYKILKTITHQVPVDSPQALRHTFECDLNGVTARYVKVVGVYYGPLPEFHASHGQESMMFADEIILR